MPGLKDYAVKQAQGVPGSLDEIANTPVTITGVRFSEGNFGVYAIITVTDENGEPKEYKAGAMLVVDALKNAEAAKAFPIKAVFRKKGRMWVVDDAS
jgi:hypothetical protein